MKDYGALNVMHGDYLCSSVAPTSCMFKAVGIPAKVTKTLYNLKIYFSVIKHISANT